MSQTTDKSENDSSLSIPGILADFFLKKIEMDTSSEDSDNKRSGKKKKSKHKKSKHRKSKRRHSSSSSRDRFSSSKMLLILLNIFCLLDITQAFFFSPSHVCGTEDKSLTCFCKNKENITISSNLQFEIGQVIVDGCGTVIVPLGAVTHLQLENISFCNIDILDIRPFAFVGVQSINDLRIENIGQFIVRQHGFAGMHNVSTIVIRNVTAKSLYMGSFGGVSNVNNFRIDDSHFEVVQEGAFIVTNFTSFTISGCKIRAVENMSFLIHNAENVLFENCDIQETSNNSFSTSYVESLSFVSCRFGVLASTSISTTSLETFSFYRCTVEELEADAFSLIDASIKILFEHNVIKIADEYSLIPSSGTFSSQNVEMDVCCNSFTCDCNIYWLWEPSEEGSYEYFLPNSYCIGKPDTNLSSLVPVLDSHKNCMTLELKILHPAENNSTKAKYSSAQIIELETKLVLLLLLLDYFL